MEHAKHYCPNIIGAFALSLQSFAATHDDGAALLPDQFEVPYCYVMQAASQGREGDMSAAPLNCHDQELAAAATHAKADCSRMPGTTCCTPGPCNTCKYVS
jgi:hypothetical protein